VLKVFSLIKRREDMSLDEFRTWILEEHAPKGRALPGLRQFHVSVIEADDPALPYHAVTELYFDPTVVPTQDDRAVTLAHERAHTVLRLNGHPGTGDNPFNVTPHLGDPNVKTADQALANPYCYEWLTDALQPNYDPARFRGQ